MKSKTSLKNKFDFRKTNYDFAKHSKWYWIASCAIVLVGLIVMLCAGLNLGLDFTGGSVITVTLGDEISTESGYEKALDKIEKVLNDNGVKIASAQKEGSGSKAAIIVKYQDVAGFSNVRMDELTKTMRIEINEAFGIEIDDVGEEGDITLNSERITASARFDLIFNAIVAIMFATSLILLYIAIRFEALSGLSAILGLAHDLVVTIAFVAIFRIPVNSSFIAALITIVGYSINNSIIIFDRIRENLAKPNLTDKTNKEIANTSIKETITRTINTTITTLIAVVALAIIGVSSIREFIVVIIIGILVGFYSSLFLVPEFWANVNRERKLTKPTAALPEEDEAETNDNDPSAKVIDVVDEQ